MWATYFQMYQGHRTFRVWGTLGLDCQILKLLFIHIYTWGSCDQGKHRKTIKPKQRWRPVCVCLRNPPGVITSVIGPRGREHTGTWAHNLRVWRRTRYIPTVLQSPCLRRILPFYSLWAGCPGLGFPLGCGCARRRARPNALSALLKGPNRPPPSNLPGMFCNPDEGPSVALAGLFFLLLFRRHGVIYITLLIYPSIHLSIYRSIYLSICLSN